MFNPFGDDAIVDVTFLTDTGVQQPDELQAVVVPRRSRLTVAVHDAVLAPGTHRHPRARPRRSRRGRSAPRSSTAPLPDAGPTREGIAVSLGATVARRRVVHRRRHHRATAAPRRSALANFADTDASVVVDVDARRRPARSPPQKVDVPARGVVAVDVTSRVPVDTEYAVTVTARAVDGTVVPVVAELAGVVAAGVDGHRRGQHPRLDEPARRWVDRRAPTARPTRTSPC